jgi:hypothetical protein
VACLEPPAWGCIWGLVAQVALPAIIDLIGRTDIFQREVVRPLVRPLLTDLFKDPFSDLILKTMQTVGLGERASQACTPETFDPKKVDMDSIIKTSIGKVEIDGRPLGTVAWNSPEMKQEVIKWEAKYRDEMLKDILPRFKKGGGQASEADLEKLVKAMQDNKPSSDELKKKLNESLELDLKINIDKAIEKVEPPKKKQQPGPFEIQIPGKTEGQRKGVQIGPVETPQGGQLPGFKVPF